MSGQLLDLSKRLEHRLASGLIDQRLCAQLRSLIGSFSHHATNKDKTLALKYDESAVRIWNASLAFSHDDSSTVTKTLPLIRAFAFVLLRASYSCSSDKTAVKDKLKVRMLRTALKVAKTCMDGNELDLATDTLQSAADHVAVFANRGNDSPALSRCTGDLMIEYWLLRATLSWKQDRLDLAEMHFAKANDTPGASSVVRTRVAELAYELGRGCLMKADTTDCIAWFEQASKALDHISQDELNADATELRMSISRDLARALIGENTEQSLSRAADLISYLESEQGLKLGILLLKIDLLQARGPVDAVAYSAVIFQIIRIVLLSDATFKTVLDHLRKLHVISSSLARQALQDFLALRLYEFDDKNLTERAVIMYIWMITESADLGGIASAAIVLNNTLTATKGLFGDEATHAAQTLCWKGVEAALRARMHDHAEQWCRLAGHDILGRADGANKSKIARKLMTVALLDGRTAVAREAFFQMPEAGQRIPASQYLLYRVALLDGDDDLVNECMESLVKSPNADPDLLYAAAQEAQQRNSRQCALKALHAILQRASSKNNVNGIQIATLVRCMVQMLLGELKSKNGDQEAHFADIGRLVTTAAAIICANGGDCSGKDRLELEWFAKTSYNVAITYMADSEPTQILLLVEACLKFCKRLQTADASQDALQRAMTCHYIAACACIILARSDDQISVSEQHYTKLIKHTTAWYELSSGPADDQQAEQDAASIPTRASQLLRFEIEALFQLKQYSRLDKVLERCASSQAHDLDLLADLVMSIHSVMLEQRIDPQHIDKIPAVMQSIVNRSWRQSGDMTKLSRWLRCVFRMTITTHPDVALGILEQATDIVASCDRIGKQGTRYPAAELEWLAGTAFNTAVDRHCAADAQGCRKWGEAALNLARAAVDSPRLFAQMQGMWMRLQG